MEDTLKSVKIRLFAQQYAFNISPAKRGWKCKQVHPAVDGRAAQEAHAQGDQGASGYAAFAKRREERRDVVARARGGGGERGVRLLRFVPFRVSSQPPGEKNVPSMEEAATTADGERASAGAEPGCRPATMELIENYVDAYLESRPAFVHLQPAVLQQEARARDVRGSLVARFGDGGERGGGERVRLRRRDQRGDAAARREGEAQDARDRFLARSPSVTSPRSRTSWTG